MLKMGMRKPANRLENRKIPKQDRSRRTYETILDGVASVICECGSDHLTTNRVAEKSGISIGSLYQYFPSKEALIAALIDRAFSRELLAAREFFNTISEDVGPKVMASEFFARYYRLKENDFELRKALVALTPSVDRDVTALKFHEEIARILIDNFHSRFECKCRDRETSLFMLQYLLKGIALSSVDIRISAMNHEVLAAKWADILLNHLGISKEQNTKLKSALENVG